MAESNRTNPTGTKKKPWKAEAIAGGSKGDCSDGKGSAAKFNQPADIVIASDGSLYVADEFNHCIRKISFDKTAKQYTVSIIAGSSQGFNDKKGSGAQFYRPTGLAIATDGSLYVADYRNHLIRKIEFNTKNNATTVSTFAGKFTGNSSNTNGGYRDGSTTDALFKFPVKLAIAVDGSLYVADYGNHLIRKIEFNTNKTTTVSTFAGNPNAGYHFTKGGFKNGTGSTAEFNNPTDIAIASDGSLYIADKGNHRIRKIEFNTKNNTTTVSTLAGSSKGSTDGIGTAAQFNSPMGLAITTDDSLYVADAGNNRIRKINLKTQAVSTLDVGFNDGKGFNEPSAIAIASDGSLYVADHNNHRILKIIDTTK